MLPGAVSRYLGVVLTLGAGLVSSVVPAGALAQPVPPPVPSAPKTVYLNFADGTETLSFGAEDDAAANRSSTGTASPYPAFRWPTITTGVTTQAELVRRIVQRVHAIFLPYNVLVTTTRPSAGPYVMVLIGGHPRDIGVNLNVAGLAFMDCNNEVPADIVFAFSEMLRGSEHGLIVTIAQEAAHAFGLEHTANLTDIMYPTVVPEQVRFPDEDSQVFGEQLCGATTQNSHLRMLMMVGGWLGDDKPIDDGTRADRDPPTLVLLEPGPTATVDQPFTVRVRAEDEGGIDHVVLAADGDRGTLHRPPFAWSLSGFPEGPLSVTVTAYDASGNISTQSATYSVRASGPMLPGGCNLGGGGDGGGEALPAPVFVLGIGVLLACIRRPRPL